MENDRTFALIKPGAVKENHYGEIIFLVSQAGFTIKAMRMAKLSLYEAKRFYRIHEGKEFYERLTTFMSSGPIVAMVLEKDNAIEDFRKLIGNTNPEKSAEGTIRKRFGTTITKNAIHGADSPENAVIEWSFFFAEREILE